MSFIFCENARPFINRFLALPVVRSALERLKSDLDPALEYHSHSHTVEVLEAALSFAVMEGRTERELELLAIAAAYHDAGFLEQAHANEAIGAQMAAQAMEEHDYDEEGIKLVRQLILDTTVVATFSSPQQHCSTPLSPYLLDGDVANLGTVVFFDKIERLAKERNLTAAQARVNALQLIKVHVWHSAAAKSALDSVKQANIRKLTELIERDRSGKS